MGGANMVRREAGALQLLLCAALCCAAKADHGGRNSVGAGISCGFSTAALVAPSRVRHPTTHLRLRGGCASDAAGLDARLQALINQAPVMLFMKGEPDAPQCGFSRTIVALLREHGVNFEHFDILEDEEVRQGLKRFSNWPTYPQVYAHGELLGGLDVCKDLAESGELARIGYTCKDTSEEPHKDTAGTEEEEDMEGGARVSGAHLQDKIRGALGAHVVQAVDESDGCGAKFSILVVAERFVGMPLIDRQRAVHAAIKDELPRIHAISLKCKTPEQHQRSA